MNHKFTTRELVLLLLATVLALGIFYYKVVYKNVQSSMKSYDTLTLEAELNMYQTKAIQENKMKKAIEEASSNPQTGTIEVYDNLANEVAVLGSILNPNTDSISISWAQPTLLDTTVRRQAAISFTCSTYDVAKSVLEQLSNMQYRNLMNNVNVDMNNREGVRVSLTITFFETSKEAKSLDGLIILEDSTNTE